MQQAPPTPLLPTGHSIPPAMPLRHLNIRRVKLQQDYSHFIRLYLWRVVPCLAITLIRKFCRSLYP